MAGCSGVFAHTVPHRASAVGISIKQGLIPKNPRPAPAQNPSEDAHTEKKQNILLHWAILEKNTAVQHDQLITFAQRPLRN